MKPKFAFGHQPPGGYICVQECGAAYGTDRGLTKHQTACKIARRVWEEDSRESAMNRKMAKRRKLEERLQQVQFYRNVHFQTELLQLSELTKSVPSYQNSIEKLQVDAVAHTDSRSYQDQIAHPVCQPIRVCEGTASASAALGRGKRVRRQPKRFRDVLPEPEQPMLPFGSVESLPLVEPRCLKNFEETLTRTAPNSFGIIREYLSKPSFNPDHRCTVEDLMDLGEEDKPDVLQAHQVNAILPTALNSLQKWYAPLPNATICRLLHWFWTGSEKKSLRSLDELVQNVLLTEDYDQTDLTDFSARKEQARLDNFRNFASQPLAGTANVSDSVHIAPSASSSGRLVPTASLENHEGDLSTHATTSSTPDGWKAADVEIALPDGIKHPSGLSIPRFTAGVLHYRSLIHIIRSVFQSKDALRFHYTPFKKYWQAPNRTEERIYDELYSSDVWLEAHGEVQKQAYEREEKLECAIAALMLWSDSTHLTNFGTASLWPIYLFFGNQSKYERCRPTAHACHHLAYIPSLPDTITDKFRNSVGKMPSADILAHCRRELMHAVWTIILDESFTHAYRHGIIVTCADGITRRIFPRLFTYSADYPERVLLASIRYLAGYPCTRCLVAKQEIHKIGMKQHAKWISKNLREDSIFRRSLVERAREFIYVEGRPVKGAYVQKLLETQSLVPTTNAFSNLLSTSGSNYFRMFVIDLMHEFELGVWRMVFTHLIRLLAVQGPDSLSVLNERFRAMPTFGTDTIRKFSNDASDMKKLAARDFEDLLQCALPVFEGLFPEPHNTVVLDLLFALAMWHALAKLRMHTDCSLKRLEEETQALGHRLRKFKDVTCSAYKTRELPSEVRKRGQQALQKAAEKGIATPGTFQTSKSSDQARYKEFNMNTIKVHALGEYVSHIRHFGTTDSYSTQPGELQHRRVKRFYARTNKNNATRQMTNHERREDLLRRIIGDAPPPRSVQSQKRKRSTAGTHVSSTERQDDSRRLRLSSPRNHYIISHSRHEQLFLPSWLREQGADPATKDFYKRLKEHLLRRLLGLPWDGDEGEMDDEACNAVHIENHLLYIHRTIRLNYTTYDVRRNQDSLNPRTHCDIMVLAHEEDEAAATFWYARILGVYHANVRHFGDSAAPEPREMHFLWVRWLGATHDEDVRSGWANQRLPMVGFVPESDMSAFGFLDPREVVRGVHLLPAFHHGRTKTLLGPSIARPSSDNDEDWRFYYIGSFVDRDMYVRFANFGIGHQKLQRVSTNVSGQANQLWSLEEEELASTVTIPGHQVDSESDSGSESGGGDEDEHSDHSDPDNDVHDNSHGRHHVQLEEHTYTDSELDERFA